MYATATRRARFGLSPPPVRLNTLRRVKLDGEMRRIDFGRYGVKYEFLPMIAKTSGSALGTIYLKKRTSPRWGEDKEKGMKKWLGKLGMFLEENSAIFGDFEINKDKQKCYNASALLEYVANCLYRIFGDGMFETPKMRLKVLLVYNEILKESREKYQKFAENLQKNHGIKETLRVLSKWSDEYRDLCKLKVRDGENSCGFMEYINSKLAVPETVIEPESGKEVRVDGIMAVLSAGTSIGDVDCLGVSGRNIGYVVNKDDKNQVISVRIVKVDPGLAFHFHFVRGEETCDFENPKDIRFCTNYRHGIKWDNLTECQKHEFIEVKMHHCEIVKDRRIFEYLFFRDGKFEEENEIAMPHDVANFLIRSLLHHVERERKLYLKDIEEYEIIREETLKKNAKQNYDDGDFDRSLCLFEKLLESFQRNNFEEKEREVGETLSCIGRIETKRGNLDRSLKLLQKSVVVLRKGLTSDHPSIATSLNYLGNVYDAKGDVEQAAGFYEKALEIRRKTLRPDHPDIGESLNNLGKVYCSKGDFDLAISFLEKGLEIDRRSLPSDHSSIATSLSNLGSVYHLKRDFAKAIEFCGKALDIQRKILPSDHPEIAISLTHLGDICHSKREFDEAVQFYEKALEIQRKTLPSDHPRIAISLNNLGSVYNSKMEFDMAVQFYEKALEIQRKTLPANHSDIATSLNNLGVVYRLTGDFDKAVEFCDNALEIARKTLPPDHSDIATCLVNLGNVYNSKGDFVKAIEFYEKALEIQRKTLPSDHPNIAMCLNNLGHAFMSKGELEKAIEYCEKALDVYRKTLPSDHPKIATCLNNWEICTIQEEISTTQKGAIEFYEKALEIFQITLPSDHLKIAMCLHNLGATNYSKGDFDPAIEFYEKALEITQKTYKKQNDNILNHKFHICL